MIKREYLSQRFCSVFIREQTIRFPRNKGSLYATMRAASPVFPFYFPSAILIGFRRNCWFIDSSVAMECMKRGKKRTRENATAESMSARCARYRILYIQKRRESLIKTPLLIHGTSTVSNTLFRNLSHLLLNLVKPLSRKKGSR